ncbi:MAG: hypothetical protein ACKOW8_09810 [Flavobacteriales bacterium]
MKKVTLTLLLTFVVIVFIGAVLQIFTSLVLPPAIWMLPIIYLVISLLSYRLLTQGASKSPHRFVLGVNLSVLIKLLCSAIICAIYFALKLPEKITFTFAVLLNYVLFSIVLLRFLLKSVKNV